WPAWARATWRPRVIKFPRGRCGAALVAPASPRSCRVARLALAGLVVLAALLLTRPALAADPVAFAPGVHGSSAIGRDVFQQRGQSFASGSATFSDAYGDANLAPDFAAMGVSNNSTTLIFDLVFSVFATMPSSYIVIGLDTDANPGAGFEFG